MHKVKIIGGGLAGCEAAWQLAKRGIKVEIYEMRQGQKTSPAHKTDGLAELVCSNSLRNDDVESAIGLLHEEMRMLDSLIIKVADKHRVPAGSALAVDRDEFSQEIENTIKNHPNITLIRQEIDQINPEENIIIASGPITSDALSQEIIRLTDVQKLHFFDAISPIVHHDSIDFSKCWAQSRYDKGEGKDYLNCPMDKRQYEEFIADLVAGEKMDFKEWEKDTPYFEGCLPIEVMAERGVETLRYGPLKPVGLTNPYSPDKSHAVVQLRQDNKQGTLFNIVGFQTKLKYHEQKRIFTKIPGLENAQFARLGGIHRNSFIQSPKLLDQNLSLKNHPTVKFAGQITGVEGYVESASMGLICGIMTACELEKKESPKFNNQTAIGSLLNYITNDHILDEKNSFQPMNINFGLFEPLTKRMDKKSKRKAYSQRALEEIGKIRAKFWATARDVPTTFST
jgi:methylenetetrahydrofolate--tRNA-(uracil-5-)-methyltransferase